MTDDQVDPLQMFKNMNNEREAIEVVMPVEKVFVLWQMYKLINGVVL